MKDRKAILALLLGVVGLYVAVLFCTELGYYACLPHRPTPIHGRVCRMIIGNHTIRYGSSGEFRFREVMLDWVAVPSVLLAAAIVIGYRMAAANTIEAHRLAKWEDS
ncbi:MAG TPA: hypothetical protein VGO59_18235 [Verrucomicrobiae bacterium]